MLLALCACGDNAFSPSDARNDRPRDAGIDASTMPATLMETGLCANAACAQINPDIHAYKPRFELWSDSAVKRRWIQLPAGTKIDTTDMDFWQFPVGTKVWKEFTRDTIRVETRFIWRVGPGETNADWFYGAYVWNQTQDAAVLFDPFAGAPDANGTQHDVPSRLSCKGCHDNTKPSRVLGFSALQLDFANTTAGELDLADVVAMSWLTAPPTGSGGSYFGSLPGTTYEPSALGYLHANCGHCHNPNSQVATTPVALRLTVGTLGSLATTPTYVTAVDVDGALPIGGRTKIVSPGMPNQSLLIYRFESAPTATEHMPALGSEMMDPAGQTILRDWISNIP